MRTSFAPLYWDETAVLDAAMARKSQRLGLLVEPSPNTLKFIETPSASCIPTRD